MPIDNKLYDRLADDWWGEDSVLAILRTSPQPAARRHTSARCSASAAAWTPRGCERWTSAVAVACWPRSSHGLGCRVTGIDPSAASIGAARAHARQSGLDIEYVEGPGEQLPFEDGSFDFVYCCDVLEHVVDLEQVLRETARVLRPGGVYVYDTINRTLRSRLLTIKLMQEWRSTAFMEPDLHDWDMFIKPAELEQALAGAGLDNRDSVGLSVKGNPLGLLRDMRRRARGEISYGELGRRLSIVVGGGRWASYAGYAVKPS